MDGLAALLGHLFGAAETAQPVHGCLEQVHGVRVPEALREDVADARELEHGADAAPGDDAGSLARRPQQHARGVGTAEHLVRDGRALLGHLEEVLLRVVDGLRDGERDLAGLAVPDAHAADLVPDHHERGEREAPASFDDLRDTVDLDHALLQLARVVIQVPFDLTFDAAQNVSPPSLAPSASALTRPW